MIKLFFSPLNAPSGIMNYPDRRDLARVMPHAFRFACGIDGAAAPNRLRGWHGSARMIRKSRDQTGGFDMF